MSWIGVSSSIVILLGSIFALVKYFFAEYVKLSEKLIIKEQKAYQLSIDNFSEKLASVNDKYAEVQKNFGTAVAQLSVIQKNLNDSTKQDKELIEQIKTFVTLTKDSMQKHQGYFGNVDRELFLLKEQLGKVILK